VKTFAFRPPGFAANPLVGVAVPELSDLDDRTLGRLVAEMRHRLMVRDVLPTIERLWWNSQVSMAVWSTTLSGALDELHTRALKDHVLWLCQRLASRVPGSASDLADFRRSYPFVIAADIAIVNAAANDQATGKTPRLAMSDGSYADNAIAAERCESEGLTTLMRTPVRCQGANGHQGKHFNGPRIARTWWA
jgi:hypothetical protein